jgi:tetratricopeptide (TPR) repeat protein/serine phosphatase RsbU (regulator of sigma subunit)
MSFTVKTSSGQFSPEQQRQIDSLNLIIDAPSSHDTSLASAYVGLSEILYVSNFDTLKYLCEKAENIANKGISKTTGKAEKLSYQQSLGAALNNLGYVYNMQGEIEKALVYFHKAIIIEEEIDDKGGVASSLMNTAYAYIRQGEIEKALVYFHKALIIEEEIDDKEGVASCLNNLGGVYKNQGKIKKALEYFHKALVIREDIGDKRGIANSLNNIGAVHDDQGKIKKALEYYHKALVIRENIGDKRGIATSLNNIGHIHDNQEEREKALEYYHKALVIREDIGDRSGIANSLNNIGSIYKEKGNLPKAKHYSSQAMKLAKELGYPNLIRNTASSLYAINKQQGNSKEALEMHELFIKMRDSINNKETYKAAVEQEAKYNYEKQVAIDSIANAEAEKVQNAKLEAEQAKSEKNELEVKAQKKQKWFLYGGLGLVALFALFMFQRFRVTKRQKEVIDKQKSIVEDQKTAVEQQKEQIEQQHQELEETHQEISDSIKYAERLQLAILPPKEDLKSNLGNAFVLFQPKDVVSGDFYWMQHVNETVYFAAADCTGHGVPGAMVSVVCSNALNRSVKEFGLTEPKDILNKTRALVIETFARSGKDVKDGMDIALCAKQGNKLIYSGANNPLWIITKEYNITEEQKEARSTIIKGNKALVEYKPNKQPVGLYEGMKSFEQQELQLNEGDGLYLFTDGFADQFGGERGKKLMYKPFKKLLMEVQELPMEEQRTKLDQFFGDWKGGNEQVDDVCVIGVRI